MRQDHGTLSAMEITTTSIQFALRKIAHLTCGSAPRLVPVVALGHPTTLRFATCIPSEYRSQVYAYLAECLALPTLTEYQALVLSADQASALISLAATPCGFRAGFTMPLTALTQAVQVDRTDV
jgi:hypothetical protein